MTFFIQLSVIVLLVAAWIVRGGVRKFYFNLKWTSRNQSGLHYQFGQLLSKGRAISGFVLRFNAPAGFRLLIRRETWFDQLGKALRIAVEPQIGDAAFDELFYVDCEDADVVSLLTSNIDMSNVLRRLQNVLKMHGSSLRELRWENGDLDIAIDSSSVTSETDRESDVLVWLQPLISAIRSLSNRSTRLVDRALLPRIIHLSAWVGGGIGCLALAAFFSDRLLKPDDFARWTMNYSLGAFVIFLIWVFVRLGPVPRRHRFLLESICIGLPGFLFCGFLIARAIDIDLDRSVTEKKPVTRAALYSTNDGYRLSFTSDELAIWVRTPLHLSATEHDRLQPLWPTETMQRDITLILHSGKLGFGWIEPE